VFGSVYARQFQRQRGILAHREPRQKVCVLKYIGGLSFGIGRGDPEEAPVRLIQLREDAQQRGFPAARRTENGKKLTRGYIERQVVYNNQVAKSPANIVQTQSNTAIRLGKSLSHGV
jgi:hypothetical protein